MDDLRNGALTTIVKVLNIINRREKLLLECT